MAETVDFYFCYGCHAKLIEPAKTFTAGGEAFVETVVPFMYLAGAVLVGIATFIGSWIYAVATYGWFLGLGLGWIPAIFLGLLAGAAWPLLASGAIVLFLLGF